MGSIIRSVGIYSPKRILDNFELERILAASGQVTSNEWIVKRTGITKRRIAGADETVETMAVAAALDALKDFQEGEPLIEHVIVATNTGERRFPSVGGFVQDGILQRRPEAIRSDAAFSDSYGGCGGINLGLMYGDALLESGMFESLLVIGSDKLSSITDYSDRASCILFGDGATAYRLVRGKDSQSGFLGHCASGRGKDREMIHCEEGIEKVTFEEAVLAVREGQEPRKTVGRKIFLDGPAVYRYVVSGWERLISRFTENTNLNPPGIAFEDVNAVSPHLANLRMLSSIDSDHPGFLDKCNLNDGSEMEYFCNTSTASQGRRDRRFLEVAQPGDTLLKYGYGAGLADAANFYRMPSER